MKVMLVLCAICAIGCGDDAAEEPVVPQTTLTVQTANDDAIQTVDYEYGCDELWETLDEDGVFVPSVRRTGTFPSRVDFADDATSTWRIVEEPAEGSCILQVVARDANGTALCTDIGVFSADDSEVTEVNITMECNANDPRVEVAEIGVQAPNADVDADTVEYDIICSQDGTSFLSEVASFDAAIQLSGQLEVTNTDDMGNPTELWQAFVDLPPGQCDVALRVREPDGEVPCSADGTFIVAPTAPARVRLFLLCFA